MTIFPVQEIGNHEGVFFFRYTLLRAKLFNIYLHQFIRGDMDRCLHDHPWDFISIVLWGGYWEEMWAGKFWRRPGSILFRRAKTAHRVTLDPGKRAWSLVITGPKVRPWGFWEPSGWVKWKPNYSPICETKE
jgi:hypothetical protein